MPADPSSLQRHKHRGYVLSILLLAAAIIFPITVMTTVEAWMSRSVVSDGAPTHQVSSPTVIPVRIRIPALDVETQVEHLGLTARGDMDIPDRIDTVGWFRLGYVPGQAGGAVIAGHLNGPGGEAGVFARLHELAIGDVIAVENGSGTLLRFTVEETAIYPYDSSPMQRIFGPSERPMLNLITCNGAWNHAQGTFDRRLVVYARLVDDQSVDAYK